MGQNGLQNIYYSIYQYGHTFFGHNSAIFLSNQTDFFFVTQETIIYLLVMRNHDFDAFFGKNPIFGGKIGVAATVAQKGLGPQDPTKNLANWVDLFGQPLTRKLVFKNFGPESNIKMIN